MTFWCWVESAIPLRDVPYVQASATLLAAFVAISAFVSGIWFYVRVKRREAFKLGTELILQLSDRFATPKMHAARAKAAAALLAGSADTKNLDKVLDFFEEVGFFLRRGAIDAEAAYMFFWHTFAGYFGATTEYRAAARAAMNQDVWGELEAGYYTMERFEDFKTSGYKWRWAHGVAWKIRRLRLARSHPANPEDVRRSLRNDIEQTSKEAPQAPSPGVTVAP